MNQLFILLDYLKHRRRAKSEPIIKEVVEYDKSGLMMRDVEHLKQTFPIPRRPYFKSDDEFLIAEGRRQVVEYIENHILNGRREHVLNARSGIQKGTRRNS